MTSDLPTIIDCRRAAAVRERVANVIAAPRFTRIQGLFRLRSEVTTELDFALGSANQVCITGRIYGLAEAQCQRCLETASIGIESKVDYEVDEEYTVGDENSKQMFDLLAFIEDELILAYAKPAMHPRGECAPPGDPALIADGTRNPFDVLSKLRQNTE